MTNRQAEKKKYARQVEKGYFHDFRLGDSGLVPT